MDRHSRSTQVLKQEAENIGLTGKEVSEYVTEQQTLDREERAAWRDAQKFHAEEKKRADEIKIQIAQIETVKEQAKIEADKELELKAQQDQASVPS